MESADAYIDKLKRFQAVAATDFSTYLDFPKAIRIYNVFRNRWLAAYMQMRGVTVVPQIEWGFPEDFDWILDGQPKHSDIIVSSVGNLMNLKYERLFIDGYKEILSRLEPEQVFFYGTVPEECKNHGKIIEIKPFHMKFREGENGEE